MFFSASIAQAADWSVPEQQLARKIAAATGPSAVALTIDNRSSLNRREADIVSGGLRSALGALGIRFVAPEQAAATVAITLSENLQSYVWVAEIRRAAAESSVVIVSAPRSENSALPRDSVPLNIRKIPLWNQEDRILDVAVLEENATPTRIAVLDTENVSLYRLQSGKWQPEQTLALQHSRPWPRDLRGRLVLTKNTDKDRDKDHLLDVYLPGVLCRSTASTPLALSCHDSDDPWPLVSGAFSATAKDSFPSAGASTSTASIPQLSALYASNRNFFTGALTPGVGKFTIISKFYSAAFLPRDKYLLWLFATADGSIHTIDGTTDFAANSGWGSNLASVKTVCGAGWQVLATISLDQNGDSIRAFEFPDRDAVPVSTAIDFNGEVTALWTEARGDSAIAIVKNHASGNYEAFRLAMDCSQ